MNATLIDFTCPRCGWNHHDFRATGHFRCASCLEAAFGPMFDFIARAENPDTPPPTEVHRGTPNRLVADLRIGIQLAVKDENYELAAALRDTLLFLRQKLQG